MKKTGRGRLNAVNGAQKAAKGDEKAAKGDQMPCKVKKKREGRGKLRTAGEKQRKTIKNGKTVRNWKK